MSKKHNQDKVFPHDDLELTSTQQLVLETLKDKQTEQYPLSDWYRGVLYAINNKDNPDRISQAAQSLRELLEKLPRIIQENNILTKSSGLKEARRNIHNRFIKDKNRYNEKWVNQAIDHQLDKTLRQIDKYLELSQTPTRRERIHSAMEKFDPMADALDQEIQKKKEKQFHLLWKEVENFSHHQCSPDEQHFMECFSSIDKIIIGLFAPITEQDHSEIKIILEKSELTKVDIYSMEALITRKGANWKFFFKNANERWIPMIKEWGFFKNPPNVQPVGDGRVSHPFWWPILYIQRIANSAPEQVVNILVNLPETDNQRIFYEICEIACQLEDINLSLKLKPWIIKYVKSPDHWITSGLIANLLRRWGTESEDSKVAALELLRILVSFKEDPMSEVKKDRRLKNPDDWTTSLEPQPRFDQSEYQRILEKGVNPIAEKDPLNVALILIEVCEKMICLRMHQDVLDKTNDEDLSEIWCRCLDKPDDDYQNSEETLVYALTFACKKIHEKFPESIEVLEENLSNQRWKIFKRLRQYLYTLNLNERTLPCIQKLILEHKDYARWEHHYEFQQMIYEACRYFGARLLSEEERARIFDEILTGPSKNDCKNFLKSREDEFTEEKFKKWQCNFHRMQLHPFAPILTGKYQRYFQELESEYAKPLSDEDYSSPGVKIGGMVSYRSPRSSEDLTSLKDEELLAYINKWSKERWEDNAGLVQTNIEALADVFQNVFKDSIISDNKRLTFWMDNRDKVERPIYIKAIIQAIQEYVKERNFEQLTTWLNFCNWVLSHSDIKDEKGVQQRDDSRKHPSWRSSRRAAGDFIDTCLKKEVNVPFDAREKLAELLKLLCTQFDWQLDCNKPVLLNCKDQIVEAINNTRSRALESLIDFGFWVRRHSTNENVLEVTSILEARFNPDAEWPLTKPEYALLGLHYYRLCKLNQPWSIEHKENFFPQNNVPVWLEAFGSFLRFGHPFKSIFEILKDDFSFALEHLAELKKMEHSGRELIDELGFHLFLYYLWGLYPLKDQNSVLEKFYIKTTNDKKYWANLFHYIGYSLKNSDEHLEVTWIERVKSFFDWRFEKRDSEELSGFTFWLKAKCLSPDWRLESYSKVLDVSQTKSRNIPTILSRLNKLLAEHTAKVMECFSKITENINESDSMYIQPDKVNPIMEAGLNSSDEEVCKHAKRAEENLLKCGIEKSWNLKK